MNVLPFTPPPEKLYNLQLECAMIGALLYYPGAYAKVSPLLKASHFHEAFVGEVHAWIGGEVEHGADGGEALQMACLQAVAHKDKGKETIAFAIASTLIPLEIGYGVKKLVELAERRRLLAVAEQMAEDARRGSETAAADAIGAIVEADGSDGEIRRTSYSVDDALGDLGLTADDARAFCGSSRLDYLLGGFKPGRLYILGGRPGSGKTTCATSLTLQTALRGHGVGYFTLEMTAKEISCRLLADLSRSSARSISYSAIEQGGLSPWERSELTEAREQLRLLPYEVDERAAPTIGELRIAVQAMQRKFIEAGKQLHVVVVDHSGLVKPSGNYRGNRVAETGEVSSGLKALAKDLNIAVLALCQLNREVEGRENKKPTLADLRWAGEIEQDADVVMMVYREAYYLDKSDKRFAEKEHSLEILVRKNRSGECGKVELFADMRAAHVRDLDK